MVSGKLAALVAAALALSSSAATAQSAQPLSLANSPAVARAGAGIEDSNQLSTFGYVAIGAVVVAVILLVFVLDDDDEAFPTSP